LRRFKDSEPTVVESPPPQQNDQDESLGLLRKGVEPYIPRRTTSPRPKIDVSTTTESLPSTRLPLPETTTVTTTTEESETEQSPFPPTTTTTTTTDAPSPVNRIMVPTTEGTTITTTESTTTLTSRTTLPSTTVTTTTEFVEETDFYKDDYALDQVQEPKYIAPDVNTPSPSTTPSTAYSEDVIYPSTTPLTPSTTTVTTTTVTTEEPAIPTGQLIIHEILPTQPPLKEVSFVVGESVEDEESSKSYEETQNDEGHEKPPVSTVVRVEANVEISSSVSKPGQVSQANNETITSENGDDAKGSPTGKKVRVVIVRQRKVNTSKQISSSNGEVRQRRKISRMALLS